MIFKICITEHDQTFGAGFATTVVALSILNRSFSHYTSVQYVDLDQENRGTDFRETDLVQVYTIRGVDKPLISILV